jgi:hypothetical protein
MEAPDVRVAGRRARAMVFTRFWLYWKFVLVS